MNPTPPSLSPVRLAARLIALGLIMAGLTGAPRLASATGPAEAGAFLDTYCDRCHNDLRMSGNWSLSIREGLDTHPEILTKSAT